MVVDNDSLFYFFENFRSGHEFGDMVIHDNQNGFFCNKIFGFIFVNEKSFGKSAVFDGFYHLFRGVTLFRKYDMGFFPGRSGKVGNAYGGTEGIEIFVGMSHDENKIGFVNQFSQCLCDDTDTDTGIADRSRCFSAESFHVFSYTDNRLVTAAAQGKVERNLGFFVLLGKRFPAFYDTDREGDGNSVHRMYFPYPVQNIEIVVHHFLKGFCGNTGHEIGRAVLFDKSFFLAEGVQYHFRHVRHKRRAVRVGHFRRHFLGVVDTNETEYGS